MKFNEDTRVKLPAILHLCRLGYEYLSLKTANWNPETNIFTDIFIASINRLNPDLEEGDAERQLQSILLDLSNEDMGKAFYEKLIASSGVKLIDFTDFRNNSFHVVTELTYKNGEDEFRPDITILINGMPLVFIEVKKPNNRDGILAERDRIVRRCRNRKFWKFINITQFMIFSNNMEYDSSDFETLQGAFYAAPSYKTPIFNYFRDELPHNLDKVLSAEDDDLENYVLKDNNLIVIKQSPEFLTNKNPSYPTNRILTSLCSPDRLSFLLRYAFAYVRTEKAIEKHIMRYPQIFATKAIKNSLEEGKRKGIIWHTQGSGKTALAFYNVKYLTDYFQQKGIIPKFYFIVDRLDLLKQAKTEFSSRGLIVHTVNSKLEFLKDLKTTTAIHNNSGRPEITVVNIQKFADEDRVVQKSDYNVSIQRIYFLDEVHRSYNPTGSFLANLSQSDENSIKIGLTGTPLIGEDVKSRDLFGDYIHKYYYNASIADGYTLRLIREEISSDYKIKLQEVLERIHIEKGVLEKQKVFAHESFVEPMLDYILNDMQNSRLTHSDPNIGCMVVCDSSAQARMMYAIFQSKYVENSFNQPQAAEPYNKLKGKKREKYEVGTAALILHDVGTKDEQDEWINAFKEGEIDMLIVFNMLLTGFDSGRLKKLYLGRIIRRHGLLQALTRVNRTYHNFRYGFVVDFADITKEFDATNKAYFEELKLELGDEMEGYTNLFKSKKEIEEEIQEIKDVLFRFETNNAEIFQQQISQISDRETVLKIKRVLQNARELYNVIRLLGHYDLLDIVDFKKLDSLYKETVNHLALLNSKEALENNTDETNLLNIALEDIIFSFTKLSEEELIIADQLKDILRKTREGLESNFDKKDPEFISLYDELKRLFKMKNLDEVSQDEMRSNIGLLNKIYDKVKELNRRNNQLKTKYREDPKYARTHKRLLEREPFSKLERQLWESLTRLKEEADTKVLQNRRLLSNESYFTQQMKRLVIDRFESDSKITLDADSTDYINDLVVNEYLNEYKGIAQ
jgi:type I restriction enzyme R subunit